MGSDLEGFEEENFPGSATVKFLYHLIIMDRLLFTIVM